MILIFGTHVLNLANVLEWRVGVDHMDGAEYEKIWLYVSFSHDIVERVRRELLRRCTDILTEALSRPPREGAVDFYGCLNRGESISNVMPPLVSG